MRMLRNPILPGFYPDPSVCRVGSDYYMVTSTFEYFPGVPIFHSRDLAHWHQIGHCLTRPSQLPLPEGTLPSKGIYAPTIRWRRGTFYMITTLVRDNDYRNNINFYVTADNPAGPWSEPIIIEGAEGIDPTIFFTNDKAYYLGNMRPDPTSTGSRNIWLQELDLQTGTLLGEKHILRTDGAVYNAHCPEAPHLYHIGDYYYLMISEGGTEKNHAVTIFRSKDLFGPYEVNPRNPIFTHRNLARSSAINSTGHADLVETPDGEWWAFMLASRPDGGSFRILGRETYAAPVIWEDGWPVISPETGRMEFAYPAPDLPELRWSPVPACEQFDSKELPHHFSFLRTPDPQDMPCSLTERPGYLRLYNRPKPMTGLGNPSFVGRRQQHLEYCVRARMSFTPKAEGEWAGLTILMSAGYQLRMEVGLRNGAQLIRMVQCIDGNESISAYLSCPAGDLLMKIEVTNMEATFSYAFIGEDGFAGAWMTAAQSVNLKPYSVEDANRFTGTFIGMHATSEKKSRNFADFDWFEYQPIE